MLHTHRESVTNKLPQRVVQIGGVLRNEGQFNRGLREFPHYFLSGDSILVGMAECEQDEHRWEMKGVGHGGGGNTTIVGFQCRDCGKAKINQYNSSEKEVIYDGYSGPPNRTNSDD